MRSLPPHRHRKRRRCRCGPALLPGCGRCGNGTRWDTAERNSRGGGGKRRGGRATANGAGRPRAAAGGTCPALGQPLPRKESENLEMEDSPESCTPARGLLRALCLPGPFPSSSPHPRVPALSSGRVCRDLPGPAGPRRSAAKRIHTSLSTESSRRGEEPDPPAPGTHLLSPQILGPRRCENQQRYRKSRSPYHPRDPPTAAPAPPLPRDRASPSPCDPIALPGVSSRSRRPLPLEPRTPPSPRPFRRGEGCSLRTPCCSLPRPGAPAPASTGPVPHRAAALRIHRAGRPRTARARAAPQVCATAPTGSPRRAPPAASFPSSALHTHPSARISPPGPARALLSARSSASARPRCPSRPSPLCPDGPPARPGCEGGGGFAQPGSS